MTMPRHSPWAPLRQRLFRALWIASVASNIGTWMQDVGAAWLMTSLAPQPLMVASVQVASTLPVLLLALPAGALADIVDRRRLLIAAQVWMLLVAGTLGLATALQAADDRLLLGLTLCLGLGSAFTLPAWAAIIPELVPREQLQAAVTLNGLAINVSRAVGPALAGLLLAWSGPATVFLVNAGSFIGVVAVLAAWKRPPRDSALPAERLWGAMRAGFRYVRHARPLLRILVRAGAFFLFASAPWALLPLLVRQEWGAGPTVYGLLLGAIGGGAVAGAFLLPTLRGRSSNDRLLPLAALVYAGMMAALALVREPLLALAPGWAAGSCWLIVLTSLQGAAQAALPAWVRARGLALVMVVVMGGMAGGGLLWGKVASRWSIPEALLIAATGLTVATLLTAPLRIGGHEGLDLTPSLHWPLPDNQPAHDRGPVLVTLTYQVAAEHRRQFAGLMKELHRMRRRDGAYYWQLFRDTEDPGRYLEIFLVESWLEHLRQHERVTVADRNLQERIQACLVPNTRPTVSHLVADAD